MKKTIRVGKGGLQGMDFAKEICDAFSCKSQPAGSAMDEELTDELNDTLRLVFMAGRKIRRVDDLERFERTLALALSEGWDAEGDEDVDYMVGLM